MAGFQFHRYRHGERTHLHQSRQCRDRSREDTEQAGLARNRLLSALISNLGPGSFKLALVSFLNRSIFPLVSPSHLSLDCALNRPFIIARQKIFFRKRGGNKSRASRDAIVPLPTDVLEGTTIF